MLDAAGLLSIDLKKLFALVQSKQADLSDGMDVGAPAPEACKIHSTSRVDVLEALRDTAEGGLCDVRKADTNSRHRSRH